MYVCDVIELVRVSPFEIGNNKSWSEIANGLNMGGAKTFVPGSSTTSEGSSNGFLIVKIMVAGRNWKLKGAVTTLINTQHASSIKRLLDSITRGIYQD